MIWKKRLFIKIKSTKNVHIAWLLDTFTPLHILVIVIQSTQFLISTVALLLANTEKQAVQHPKVQKSCQCTQQGYHCFTDTKNRYGNVHMNINTCRSSHTASLEVSNLKKNEIGL